jgi:flagellar biosynthesis/type III secretory pathway chaperone
LPTKDEFSAKVGELTFDKKSHEEKYKTKVDKDKGNIEKPETPNNQIITHKEELVDKLEKTTEEIKTIEKHAGIKLLSHFELSEIYCKITGGNVRFDSESTIMIN